MNYDVLPFSSEDEIDSPLFNVNNNLYITAIFKKMTRIFMKKSDLSHTENMLCLQQPSVYALHSSVFCRRQAVK